jgi:hypothetical protein
MGHNLANKKGRDAAPSASASFQSIMNRKTTPPPVGRASFFHGCTGNDMYVGLVKDGHVNVVLRRPPPDDPLYRAGERIRIIKWDQRRTWKGKRRQFTATVVADQQQDRPVKIRRDGNNHLETFAALYLERLDSHPPFHELLFASIRF